MRHILDSLWRLTLVEESHNYIHQGGSVYVYVCLALFRHIKENVRTIWSRLSSELPFKPSPYSFSVFRLSHVRNIVIIGHYPDCPLGGWLEKLRRMSATLAFSHTAPPKATLFARLCGVCRITSKSNVSTDCSPNFVENTNFPGNKLRAWITDETESPAFRRLISLES